MSAEAMAVPEQFPFPGLEAVERTPLVVATLGPATDPYIEQIAQIADVARIHSAHNTITAYNNRAAAFLAASPEHLPRFIFADLEGLKVRTSTGTQPKWVSNGEKVHFVFEGYEFSDEDIRVQDDFSNAVSVGDPVSMGDSALWMSVDSVIRGGRVSCVVDRTPFDEPWKIVEHKGLNFPLSIFPDVLLPRDHHRMEQIAESGIIPDLIGISYAQSPEIMAQARKKTDELGMNNVRLSPKIENQEGARNVSDIIATGRQGPQGDVPMAAFGDMVPELVHIPRITDVLVDIHTYSRLFGNDWMACTGLGQNFKEKPVASTAEALIHGLIARLGGWLSLSGDELAMNDKYPVEAVQSLRDAVDHNAGRAALSLVGLPSR